MTLTTYVDNFILFFLILFFLYLSAIYTRFMARPLVDNLWITRRPFENPLFIGYYWGACQGLATAYGERGLSSEFSFWCQARFLVILSNLGVIASRLEGAQRPCSREEILLGFLQEGGGPERIKVS